MTKLELLKQELKEKQELVIVTKNEITELKQKIRETRLSEMCGCPICLAELTN